MALILEIRYEDPSSTKVFTDGNAIALAAQMGSVLQLPMPEEQALTMIDRCLQAEYGAEHVSSEGPQVQYKWVYDPDSGNWVLVCSEKQTFTIDVDWPEPIVLEAEVGMPYRP